jgi:amino acid adenylation domain-containing protein
MDVPVQVVAGPTAATCPLISLENADVLLQDTQLEQFSTALQGEAFDLAHGPLLRTRLFRLSAQRHVLLLSLPALCADASSLVQVIAELARLYAVDGYGRDTADEEPLQYIDVSTWQNKLLASESARGQRESWQKIKLSRMAAAHMPFEEKKYGRKLHPDNTDAVAPQKIAVPLDLEMVAQIMACAKQFDVSSSAFLLTCWKLLLQYFTNDPHTMIGVACNGRIYEELATVLGLLTRFVPVSTPSAKNQIFSRDLQAVDASLQEAIKEQAYFAWDETTDNEQRFFPLAFEYISSPASFAAADGLELSLQHLSSCTAPFVLKLSVFEIAQHLQCEIYYDSNVVSFDMAHQLAVMLQTLLTSAAEQPQAPVATLRMLPCSLEDHLLHISRAAKSELEPSVFQQIFEDKVLRVPDQTALISGNERLTYYELNCQANRLARILRGYGVGPGQLVGLCISRSVQMIVGLLAILKAGGAYVPLDPESPPTRSIYQLQDVQATLLLTQNAHLARFSAWNGRILCLESAMEQSLHELDTNLPLVNEPQDLAYVIYTSGSTGMPKGVMIQQRSVVNYTLDLCKRVGQEPSLHFATVSTLAADLGNTAIFCALASGGCLQVLEYETITSGNAFAQWVAQHPIDVLKIVPSHLAALLTHEQAATLLPRHSLISGGEALPLSLLERLQELGGECTVFNHYGPTETTIGTLVNKLGKVSDLLKCVTVQGIAPLGQPITNGETYILDDLQQLVPLGVVGELYVGGVGVAIGYVHQPEQTAEHFVPHPFAKEPGARLYKTGDLVRYTLKSEIEFVGRRDSQVKLHGYRIEASEIEIALRRYANVSDAIVMLREDIPGKPLLIAYIVPRNQPVPDNTELRDFVQTYIPAYMLPSSFVYLKAFPLTANGKVDRQQLRSLVYDYERLSRALIQDHTAKTPVQPRDFIELRLLQIWEEILQISPISVTDNFFDLGGYSMLAVRLVSQIFKQLGQDLTPATLFQYPTIARLAVVLRQQVTLDSSSALVAIQPQGSKPPFFCVHPSGGTVFCYTNLARHLGLDQPLYGLQFPHAFRNGETLSSLEDLADHYITAMQSVQAEGPYLIGGWSSGGVVAFEIARQLQQKGQEIALLAVIDSTLVDQQVKTADMRVPLDTPLDLGDAAIAQDVLRHFNIVAPDAAFFEREPEKQLHYVLEAAIKANEAPADMTLAQLRYHARVRKINTFIARQYQPQSYPGRIHLFVSSEAPTTVGGERDVEGDPERIKNRQIKTWSDLAEKGLELYRVPGTHDGLIEEPHVRTLAALLQESIGNVLDANYPKS